MGNSVVIRGDGPLSALADGRPDIIESRGERVVLDADLAVLFGVETRVLNQAFKRNQQRFPGNWAWQLTDSEFEILRSQFVMSSDAWGGRRTAPWAFSEHGVVMVATILNSERAIKASQLVIEAFVDLRRSAGKSVGKTSKSGMTKLRADFMPQLKQHLQNIMSFEINAKDGKTVRQETDEFISKGINHLKSRLDRSGLENEELEARVLKALADAEESRARAATERQMTEKQRLKNQANQLRMLIRAEQAMN
jgi:ORF6N domain